MLARSALSIAKFTPWKCWADSLVALTPDRFHVLVRFVQQCGGVADRVCYAAPLLFSVALKSNAGILTAEPGALTHLVPGL